MIINDINYLEVSNEEIFGGVAVSVSKNAEIDVDVDVDFDFDVDLDIDKDVKIDADSTVTATGNFGSIEIEATVIGNNGFAETTQALVVTGDLVELTTVTIGGVA